MTEYELRLEIEAGTGIELASLKKDTSPDPIPDSIVWEIRKLMKEYGIAAIIVYPESLGVNPPKTRIIKR